MHLPNTWLWTASFSLNSLNLNILFVLIKCSENSNLLSAKKIVTTWKLNSISSDPERTVGEEVGGEESG